MGNIDAVFPVEERIRLWRKSNKMFKVDIETVLRFWRRNADPLRGTLIKTNNVFLIINIPGSHVHVSDIVRGVVYGEVESVMKLTEHRLRLLARGILFHKLFRRRFSPRVRAVFEVPIACSVGDVILVGNVDALVYSEDGLWLVELKSSSTEPTLNFGSLQAKMYWSMFEYFTDVRVTAAYVVTPKLSVEIDRPLSKRELKWLVNMYETKLRERIRVGG